MWSYYLQTSTYAYYGFITQALSDLRPFQVTLGEPLKFLLEIETKPLDPMSY